MNITTNARRGTFGRARLIIYACACIFLLAGCAQPTAVPAVVSTPSSGTQQPGPAPSPTGFDNLVQVAQSFVDQLVKGDFATAEASFDDSMKNALPQAKLKETWDQLIAQVGAFQKQTGTRTTVVQGYRTVFVTCQFEKAAIDVRIVFDAQGKIAGLFFSQAQASAATPAPYNPPAYVKTSSFHETDVTIGNDEWALPGTLTMPQGSGPFPGVVLVHGSGANDRDETIGPNKPFRDLAWGLASQGIAVLRYDKRTLVHSAKFAATPALVAQLTVQEETIDDALLGAQFLRQTKAVDPQRVFILGHSLGATLAPRMGQQDPTLAGLILLAGAARPLEDLMLEQYTYLFNLDGTQTPEEKTQLQAIQTQVSQVKSPDLATSAAPQDQLLGAAAAYWLDLRDYNPTQVASSLPIPMLILQGGRDYQVSATKDFTTWETALEGKAGATLKLYPQLNHLFITGDGQSSPQEYQMEGHVSQDVVDDISAWIGKSAVGLTTGFSCQLLLHRAAELS